MGLFSKEKPSEVEAAGQFVISMVKPIQKEWSGIAAELTQMLQLKQPISTDRYAAFAFALRSSHSRFRQSLTFCRLHRPAESVNMFWDASHHRISGPIHARQLTNTKTHEINRCKKASHHLLAWHPYFSTN